MRLFDLETGKEATEPIVLEGVHPPRGGTVAQFNPTGTHLVYWKWKGSGISIRSKDQGWKETDHIRVPYSQIRNIQLSPSGKHMLVQTAESLIYLYEKEGSEWSLRATVLSNHTNYYTVFDAAGDLVFSNHENLDEFFHR